jgi:hypothetical protein
MDFRSDGEYLEFRDELVAFVLAWGSSEECLTLIARSVERPERWI